MSKTRTDPTSWPKPSLSLVACVLLTLFQSMNPAAAEDAPPSPGHFYSAVRTILSTGNTVTGEPIRYPTDAPARLTAMEITLEPGQQTGWHTHPMPVFGYILDGELTVDYGARGLRTYVKGEGLAEAMNEAHNGRNTGPGPVRILAVFIGAEGMQASVPAPPPARR